MRTCNRFSCDRIIGWNEHTCRVCREADTPTLFDQPANGGVRSTDPVTSRIASASNQVARMSQKKRILIRALAGEVSSQSVADITGGQVSRASKRLGEMRDDGLLELVAIRRQPHGGTPVHVFAITDDGRRDAQLIGRAS